MDGGQVAVTEEWYATLMGRMNGKADSYSTGPHGPGRHTGTNDTDA